MTASQRPRILAVDDTASDRDLLARIFDREGYEVLLADNGLRGLELAANGEPDLILLDILMPGLDGLEVCRRLKATEATQGIPIIFLTGQASPEETLLGFQAGAVDYVTKPFQIQELMARVHVHVELRRAHRELNILHGILPTCSACKKIRDEHGTWHPIESYITERSEARFSHGMCPECMPIYFPGLT